MSVPNLIAITWGLWEIVMVLAVMLLLFGSTKLPKLARSLGSSMTEFKKGLRGEGEVDDEDKPKIDGDDDATDAKSD